MIEQVACPTDFVIVAPWPEERDAILQKLKDYRELSASEYGGRTYYHSTLPVTLSDGTTGDYSIIIMPLTGGGRDIATAATNEAIRRWVPRHVILLGIAEGVAAKRVRLGDIIVSDQIVDYELSKQTPKGNIKWKVFETGPQLLGAAQNSTQPGWMDLIRVKRPDKGAPGIHFGPVASGNQVVTFSEALYKHSEMWSKLIGVETESDGIILSALKSLEKPEFFMVRGVSDLADGNKNSQTVKKWRSYACDVAASYTIALLKSGPTPLSVSDSCVDPKVLKRSEINELADILNRSERTNMGAREDLCKDIGVDTSDLDFLVYTTNKEFALRLVFHLYQTGNMAGLRGICNAISPDLKNRCEIELMKIKSKL